VHKYLKDWEEGIRNGWREGEGWTDQSRNLVQFLEDLRTLSYEDMEQFYETEESGEIAD